MVTRGLRGRVGPKRPGSEPSASQVQVQAPLAAHHVPVSARRSREDQRQAHRWAWPGWRLSPDALGDLSAFESPDALD